MKKKQRHTIIGLLSLTVAISSCKTDSKSETTNSEFGNLPTALIDSLKSIGQEIQVTEIDPTKDNIIKGKNGTVLFIPSNSLVDEKGTPVSSKTIIELKENYSIADYITNNLQTFHNDDILQTQGMIYFSAKMIDGAKVKIDKSKPIRIEFPVKEKIKDAKIFRGKRDELGNLNWEEIDEPSKLLVPLPIRSIAPNSVGESFKDFGITNDPDIWKKEYAKDYLTFDDLSKYENTLIATREFRDRYYSYCMPDLTKIYIENINKNMWEIDELAVNYFIKDSTERVNFEFNNPPSGLNGSPPTNEQKQAHESLVYHAMEGGHRLIEIYKMFADQKLTKIDPTKRISDTAIAEMNSAFVAYDALEFGWVNVDYFFKDPKSENLKLAAQTTEAAQIINLIIPSRNVILSGIPKDDNTYYFTKKDDGYNKLPKGEKAIIICISIVENKLHFAEKEIIIGQNETEKLELKATGAETIKKRLKNYSS